MSRELRISRTNLEMLISNGMENCTMVKEGVVRL